MHDCHVETTAAAYVLCRLCTVKCDGPSPVVAERHGVAGQDSMNLQCRACGCAAAACNCKPAAKGQHLSPGSEALHKGMLWQSAMLLQEQLMAWPSMYIHASDMARQGRTGSSAIHITLLQERLPWCQQCHMKWHSMMYIQQGLRTIKNQSRL